MSGFSITGTSGHCLANGCALTSGEMAARIERLEAALAEVRHWIVCSGVEHPNIPCSMIDAALAGKSHT